MTVIASASQEAKIDDSGLEVHEEDDGEVKQASLAPWTSWNSVWGALVRC